MNKIKSMLAFAALMLCGGAWAADRVDTVWNGDFITLDSSGGKVTHLSKIIDGVTYTLELNGNRVVWDETTQSSYLEIVNTSGELGAVVTRSTGTGSTKGGTLFMKYSGLSSNSNPPNGIICTLFESSKTDAGFQNITGLKVGSVADNEVTLNGFWAEGCGAYVSRGNDATGTSGKIPAGDTVSTIAVSYGSNGENVFQRNDSDGSWTKVYRNDGAGSNTYDITRFGFGGFCSALTRTGDLKKNAKPATGLKIHSIAILCSAPTGATDANLTGFSFPAVSTATTDMVYMSHLDGNATNQGSDSTVKLSDLNTVGWYGSGKFGNNAVKANGGSYIVKREDDSAFAMFSTGWTASFWVNTSTSGDWKDVGAIKLGSVYYHFERQTGNNFAIYNTGSLGDVANVFNMNTAGTWAHIAMIAWPQSDSASPLKVEVYCNGTKAGTLSHANLCGTDGARGVTRFVIGGDGVENESGTDRRGNGGIDEVAIYNYAVGQDMLSFLAANAPVATLDSVKTATASGAVNFGAIQWSNDAAWSASTKAVLILKGDTTLTIDSAVTMGDLTIGGTGNLTIKHGENLTYSSFATPGLASVTYEVDATQANFTANAALKNYIKDAGNTQKFVFLGADNYGATIDYGTADANRWNKSVATHLVFDGGTHVLGIDNENSGLKFGANATAENPTILVKGERAVLTFKTRNPCGWNSGAPTTAGIIRVNDGATLNFNKSSGTMYWDQQFYLEPGATLNSTEDSDNFRINGGASRTAPQIYVPASTAGNTKVARITKSSGSIQSNNQANNGFTVFVGANSKLSFESQVTKSNNESAIVKIGTGILEFTKSVAAPVKILQGQVAFSGEGTVSNTLTMGYDGTIGFPEGTSEGESYTIPCTTLVAESIYRRFSVGRTTNYGAIVYNTTDKTATYYMDKPRTLAINFNSNQGKEGDTAVSAALGVETVGAVWTNVTDANKDPAIDIAVYDTSKSAASTANAQVKWGSSTNYQRGSEPVSFLKGYLDDGNHNNISGPTVEFTNIPFTKYSVVIYSWGDGSASRPFSLTNAALGESAVSYTANAMNETVTGSDNWGNRTGNLAYGVNALRVDGLTGETLTIQGGGLSGSNRGVLSAVMIIEAPNYNTWIGAENASWDTAGNWSANTVPTAADTVCLPAGTTVTASANSAVGTILGSDLTMVFTGSVAQPSDSMATALTSESWMGTVKLQNVTSSSTAQLFLQNFGNANSKVIVNGVSGWWIDKTTYDFELVVENDANGVGFTITDGSSSGSSTFKKLSGSGTLKGAGGSNQGYVINDASEFTGTIDAATKCFSFGTTSRWGQNIIVVDADNAVTIAKSWSATAGMTLNGTATVTGSDVTIPALIGSGVLVKTSTGTLVIPTASTFTGTIAADDGVIDLSGFTAVPPMTVVRGTIKTKVPAGNETAMKLFKLASDATLSTVVVQDAAGTTITDRCVIRDGYVWFGSLTDTTPVSLTEAELTTINAMAVGAIYKVSREGHFAINLDAVIDNLPADYVIFADGDDIYVAKKSNSVSIKMNPRSPSEGHIAASDANVGGFPVAGVFWNHTKDYANNSSGTSEVMSVKDGNGVTLENTKVYYYMPNSYCVNKTDGAGNGIINGRNKQTTGNGKLTYSYFDDTNRTTPSSWPYTVLTDNGTNYTIPRTPAASESATANLGWCVAIQGMPYQVFDLYIYQASDQTAESITLLPIAVKANNGDWQYFAGDNKGSTIKTTINSTWDGAAYCDQAEMVEGKNYIRYRISRATLGLADDEEIKTIYLSHPSRSNYSGRLGLAGIQLVEVENDGFCSRKADTDNQDGEGQVKTNWTEAGTWLNSSGSAINWPTRKETAYVNINADTVAEIKVNDQIFADMVTVKNSADAENASFKFLTMENLGEVAQDKPDAPYILNAPVDATGFHGDLYLQSRISGQVSLGANTRVNFVSDVEGEETTAYPYNFSGDVNISMAGPGSFLVPSSMYNAPFTVSGGQLRYAAEGTISATVTGSGTGKVVIDAGEDHVITLSGRLDCDVIVRSGVLRLAAGSAFGTTAHTVVVEDGATLDLNGWAPNGNTVIKIAGDGAGDYPYALMNSSSTGASMADFTLTADATIGGTGNITLSGRSNSMGLGAYKLTKAGSGLMITTSVTIGGTVGIDVKEGGYRVDQWNNHLREGTLHIYSGAYFQHNNDRAYEVKNVILDAGAEVRGATDSRYLSVSGALSGSGSVVAGKIALANNATLDCAGEGAIAVAGKAVFGANVNLANAEVGDAVLTLGEDATVTQPTTVTVGDSTDYSLVREGESLVLRAKYATFTITEVPDGLSISHAYVGDTEIQPTEGMTYRVDFGATVGIAYTGTDGSQKVQVIPAATSSDVAASPLTVETIAWGANDNTTLLARPTAGATALFAGSVTLADIASGKAKLVGKMKGNYANTLNDATFVKRAEYVEGKAYKLQAQMYDGSGSAKLTKAQDFDLVQVKVGDVYVILASATKGFYVNDNTDHRGTLITSETTNYTVPDNDNAYEVVGLGLAQVAQIGTKGYLLLTSAIAAAQPTDEVELLVPAGYDVEIPADKTVFATYANRITGALSGSGTYKMINTPDMTSSDNWDKTIGNWFGSGTLSSFNGTLWMARGRFKTGATVEEGRVSFKVTDGAQLFVTGGTISNPIEISGNGITFENNAIIYAALRLDNDVTYSGAITAVATADETNVVTPMVGIHNTGANIPTVSGAVICPDGIRLQTSFDADVLNVTGAIKGSATDATATCQVEKTGNGEVKVKSIAHAAVKISTGKIRLNEAHVGAGVDFDIANGAHLVCYGWPTFDGAWSIKTDNDITDVLANQSGSNPVCFRTGALTKRGTGTITMPVYFGNADGAYTGTIAIEGGSVVVSESANFGEAAVLTIKNATSTLTLPAAANIVKSGVNGYTLVLNEIGSTATYSLVQNGQTPGNIVIPENTAAVSLAPGQEATYTGEAPTVTVKITNEAGGAAYDVTDYCTVTTSDGTITTTLKDDQTTQPAVTTMAAPTEEETDKVQFTISNPIPGLFYAVSSCDTPDGTFESATGDQATSSEAKTVSIPMTFGENQKVMYYRVNVKATK